MYLSICVKSVSGETSDISLETGWDRAHVGGRAKQTRWPLADHIVQAAASIRPGPVLARDSMLSLLSSNNIISPINCPLTAIITGIDEL